MKKPTTKLGKKVTTIIDKYYDQAWDQVMRKGLEPTTANLFQEIARVWYRADVKNSIDK